MGNLLLPNGFVFVFPSDTTFDYILLFDVILGQLQEGGQMVRVVRGVMGVMGVTGVTAGRYLPHSEDLIILWLF